MRKKNGFVLIETLIVVLLLTVTLMSLYSSFAYLVNKSKERNNHDSIETIYKTYYVKSLIDATYATAATSRFKESFRYYASTYSTNDTGLNPICKAFDYAGNKLSYSNYISNYDSSDKIASFIVCSYDEYKTIASYTEEELNANPSLKEKAKIIKNDPLFNAIATYGIEKMYYINTNRLQKSQDMAKEALNAAFDASSINYVNTLDSNENNDKLIIKYEKPFVYPAGFDTTDLELLISKEASHSSVSMTDVSKKEGSYPIFFYPKEGERGEAFSGGDIFNGESFTVGTGLFSDLEEFGGKTIIGWSTKSGLTADELNTCVESTNNGTATEVLCYYANTSVKATDNNRTLYAVWCGDNTLDGLMKCNNGIVDNLKETVVDGVTTYYYDGKNNNKPLGNYYVYTESKVNGEPKLVGQPCFQLMSNFGSSTGFKAIYAGLYDSATGCTSSNMSINNSSYSFSRATGIATAGYTYYRNSKKIESQQTFWELLRSFHIYEAYVDVMSDSSTAPVKLGTYIYLAKGYKNVDGVFSLDDTAERILFDDYLSNNYKDLINKVHNEKYKYFCMDSSQTICGNQIAYFAGVSPLATTTSNGKLIIKYAYDLFKQPFDPNYWKDYKSQFSSEIRYDSAKGQYYLPAETSVIYTMKDTQTFKNSFAHRYYCTGKLVADDAGVTNLYCDNGYTFIYAMVGSGDNVKYYRISYSNSDSPESIPPNLFNYTFGSVEQRTTDSNAKATIDKWFEKYFKKYNEILDDKAVFCNDFTPIAYSFNGSKSTWYNRFNNSTFVTYVSDNKTYSSSEHDKYYYGGSSASKYSQFTACDTQYAYSYKDSDNTGNHLLKYPVALLTAEEYLALGASTNNYISDTKLAFYVMNPRYLSTTAWHITVGNYSSNDGMDYWGAASSYGLRPVISIKMDAPISGGAGTVKNPFILYGK